MWSISDVEKRLQAEIDDLLKQVLDIEAAMSKLHERKFNEVYQPWFTKARRLVTTILPERLEEFDVCYGTKGGQQRVVYSGIVALSDLTSGRLFNTAHSDDHRACLDQCLALFKLQVSILLSAREILTSALRDITTFLRAGLFDSDLESAEALVEAQLFRCAGVIAGVVLETHLRDICTQRGIGPQTEKPTLAQFNDALKNANVIDDVMWLQIKSLSELRAKCAHPKKLDPTREDVTQLIEGVRLKIKQVF